MPQDGSPDAVCASSCSTGTRRSFCSERKTQNFFNHGGRRFISGSEASGCCKTFVTMVFKWLKNTAGFFDNILTKTFFPGFDIYALSSKTAPWYFFQKVKKSSHFYLCEKIVVGKIYHSTMIKVNKFFMIQIVKVLMQVHFNIGSGVKKNIEHYELAIKNSAYIFSKVTDICLIRYYTPVEMRRKVIAKVHDVRRKPVNATSLILVPDVPGVWSGSSPALTKASVAGAIAGRAPPSFYKKKPTADGDHMRSWLGNVGSTSTVVDPGLVEFDELFPCGAPLLDFLSLDCEREDAWAYPSLDTVHKWVATRSITTSWANEVKVKEFVIGLDDQAKFDTFRADFWRRYGKGQNDLPTGVVSFDTESVACNQYDLARFVSSPGKWVAFNGTKGDLSDISSENLPSKSDKGASFTAKLMFGGSDWVHLISFNIKKASDGKSRIYACDIPRYVVAFLEEVPVIMGAGVQADMKAVEELFETLSRSTVRMKGSVDLGSLAVLAGWQLSKTGMLPLALITVGMAMNKAVSCADGKWGLRWSQIPPALQVYALGDIKMGYLTYNVLISLLIRQLFPDPELVCRLSRCSPDQWVRWFNLLVRDALVGVSIDDRALSGAIASGSRSQLMETLRVRDLEGCISLEAPTRIKFLAGLVVWPALTMGGPRYLHCVRSKYLAQFSVLQRSLALPGMQNLYQHELTPMDKMDAVFGHVDVLLLNAEKAVVNPEWQEFHYSMVMHPDLDKPPFVFRKDGEVGFCLSKRRIQLSAQDLQGRGVREAMLEWSRLSYSRTEDLFHAFNTNQPMAKAFRGWYEAFRLQYLRGTGKEPTPVPWIEAKNVEELVSTTKDMVHKLEVMERELEVQRRLVKALEEAVAIPVTEDRMVWKQVPRAAVLLKSELAPSKVLEIETEERRIRLVSDAELHKQDSQEEKLKRFVGDVEFISLHPLVSFRDANECTDGGRKTKGRAKSHPSSAYNPAGGAAEVFRQREEAKATFATQDEWEEHVPRRPRCPFSNPYEEDEEELATSPVLDMDLND